MPIKSLRKQVYFGRGPTDEYPWRTSRQIAGVQSQLQAAINQCDDGCTVTLDITSARNLIEICRQAKQAEVEK